VFAQRADRDGYDKRASAGAMARPFDIKQIRVEDYRRGGRHGAQRISRQAEG